MPQPRFLKHTSDLQQLLGQHFADVGTRARPALDVSFRLELFEGCDDCGSRKLVSLGEVSSGGQTRSRSEPSVENRRAQLLVQPAIRKHSGTGSPQVQSQRAGLSRHEEVVWLE